MEKVEQIESYVKEKFEANRVSMRKAQLTDDLDEVFKLSEKNHELNDILDFIEKVKKAN